MEKINLLKFHQSRHRKKKVVAISAAIVFLILGTAFLSFKIFYESKKLNENMGFFRSLSHLILSSDRDIAAGKDTVNILALGIGGAGHEGPYLTDTMLLISINKKDNKMAMISIPRDLLVDTYRFGKKKINHINAYAEADKAESGAAFTKDVIQELLRVPITYYVRADFSAFEQIIDAVGGIDVDVPRAFTDPLFPRFDNETQTFSVTFEKGLQHMSGRTALVYARSRHGDNNEGSDFARSRRQQQIILAMKDKVVSAQTLFSPAKMNEIFKILKKHIDTNVNAWEAIQLADAYKNLNLAPKDIAINILTSGPTGPLYATYYNSQYVLLPKKSDFSDLRAIANDPFNTETRQYLGSYDGAGDISVSILNGTEISGLAAVEALALEDLGYKVKDTGNAPTRDFEKTVVYNISSEDKSEALKNSEDKSEALKNLVSVFDANVSQTIPDWLKEKISAEDKPDFIIIVGAGSEKEN